MLYPSSEVARASFGSALRSSPDPLRLNLMGMRRIQYRWLRVADVFHLYYDMAIGGRGAGVRQSVKLSTWRPKTRKVSGLGRVDKLNPNSDAGKQHEGGEALDQLVVAGGDTA